jgi:hypothetical protein
MVRKVDSKPKTTTTVIGVFSLFITALALLVTFVAFAQGTNQSSGTFSAVSMRSSSDPRSALRTPILSQAGNDGLFAINPIEENAAVLAATTLPKPASFWQKGVFDSGGPLANQVVIADVNGDGKPDLLIADVCGDVACQTDGLVAVLLGNGDGSFKPAVTYDSGGGGATSLTVADADGDGKLDVVVANCSINPSSDCGSGVVGVLLGNGDGTFRPVVTYSSGGFGATSVKVADVNGDGKPDLLVANEWLGCVLCANGGVGVLLGNGNGTFQPAVTYPSSGYGVWSVTVADVNGDGKPDLLLTDCASDPNNYCFAGTGLVDVLLGNGDGTFQTSVSYASGGDLAFSVAVQDLNGDGKLDLAVANAGSNTLGVLLGNGDGTFGQAVAYGSGGLFPLGVAIADMNGDGIPDLIGVNDNCENGCPQGSAGVLVGQGNGTFKPVVAFNSGAYRTAAAAVADINGDGKSDIVMANSCGVFPSSPCADGNAGVLLNNTGAYKTKTVLTTSASPVLVGQATTFTATVSSMSGAIPDGEMVTFYRGLTTAPIGAATTVGGMATFTTSEPKVSQHNIIAIYNGDAAFLSSSGIVKEVVELSATSTTLSVSLNPSFPEQLVTLTATVISTGPNPPTGEVSFVEGAVVFGKAPVSGGIATLSTTKIRTSGTITAKYSGDAFNARSTGSLAQVVDGLLPTVTTLTISPNPSAYQQEVTLTATVTSTGSALPSGSVQFVGPFDRINAAVNNGVAVATISRIFPGDHKISVHYQGEPPWAPSKSGYQFVSVNTAPTVTTIVSSPNPSVWGEPVTFTASVESAIPGRPETGSFWFTNGSQLIGSPRLFSKPTIETKTLPTGSTVITASYRGNDAFSGSSASLTQVVNPLGTTTHLKSSKNPSQPGKNVIFTATVETGAGRPATAGTVTFTAGATTLGIVTLQRDGVATISTEALPAGSTTVVTAAYSGAANFSSSSVSLTQVVQ